MNGEKRLMDVGFGTGITSGTTAPRSHQPRRPHPQALTPLTWDGFPLATLARQMGTGLEALTAKWEELKKALE